MTAKSERLRAMGCNVWVMFHMLYTNNASSVTMHTIINVRSLQLVAVIE